jgi:hypothetical protein
MSTTARASGEETAGGGRGDDDVAAVIAELEEEMQEAANKLEFERAALLRDQINRQIGRHELAPAADSGCSKEWNWKWNFRRKPSRCRSRSTRNCRPISRFAAATAVPPPARVGLARPGVTGAK